MCCVSRTLSLFLVTGEKHSWFIDKSNFFIKMEVVEAVTLIKWVLFSKRLESVVVGGFQRKRWIKRQYCIQSFFHQLSG